MRIPRAFMRAFAVALALLLPLFRGDPAGASTCQPPGPPCEVMFGSTVFVGKAVKVAVGNGAAAVTTFAVIEVLNSATPLGKTVDVQHATVDGLSFTEGKSYVVYAGGGGGGVGSGGGGGAAVPLAIGRCSRTHVLTPNDQDVAFAHALPKREQAVVEGTVVLSDGGASRPKAGVEIRAAGTTTTIGAKTDGAGRFKLALPPGDYELAVVAPDLRAWQGRTVPVHLPVAAACAHPTITVLWDGRIAGTIIDASGKPVVNLSIGALATVTGRQSRQPWRLTARTAADGTYVIHEVPAGAYRVGVSLPDDGGLSPASPYPTTYYPGTPAAAKAKIVTVKRAGLVSAVDFVVPIASVVHTIRGTVRWYADGSPAPKIAVSVLPAGGARSMTALTDESGAYKVAELAGTEIVVRACLYTATKPLCVEDERVLDAPAVIDFKLPKP